MRPLWFVLDDDGEPVPIDDMLAWCEWFERSTRDRSRIVKQDYVEGAAGEQPVGVSTVFLGMDHSFGAKGPPVLWETLVFGTTLDGDGRRYTSKAAAIAGHEEFLRAVSDAWRAEHSP